MTGHNRILGMGILVALTVGCGTLSPYGEGFTFVDTGGPGTASTTTTGPTTGPGGTVVGDFDIDSIEPDYGTNAGGTLVVIQGGPFPDDPTVSVANVPGTVLEATANRITFETPAADKDDWVAVKVEGADGSSARANKSFQYWPDGDGLTGLWGEFWRLDYMGTYWAPAGGGTGPYNPPPLAGAAMVFLEPASFEYQDVWAAGMNQCAVDYNPPLNATSINTGLGSVTLSSGSTTLNLGPSADLANYFETTPNASTWVAGGTWTLEADGSADNWPGFELNNIATFPSAPTITSPAMNSGTIPTATRNTTFSWSSTGSADYVVMWLARSEDAGATIAEVMTCVATDDGSFTLDGTMWSGWDTLDGVVLAQIGRVTVSGNRLPHNDADNGLAAVSWVYGAYWNG